MFKIHENGDGTTSIFCNKTGKLICTIRGQQRNMGLGCCPVNVVEKTPKPRSYCYNLVLAERLEDLKSEGVPDDESQSIRKEDCDTEIWDEPKEDYTSDSVTSEQFARCLNLVPKEKLKNDPAEELKSTFPFRQISKTRKIIPDDIRDAKFFDWAPLLSSAGIKMLNRNPKHYFSEQTIEAKIKSYDSLCRDQLNTPSACNNVPNLRSRDYKDYPICIAQRILRYAPTHMYAFNKRQRQEKLITFKTGLSTRSRKLLRQCNKRLAVSIKRLTPEEINKWPQKRSKIGPISEDDIKGEEPPSDGPENRTVIGPEDYIEIDIFSSDSAESSDSDEDPTVVFEIQKASKSKSGKYTKLLTKNCCVNVTDVVRRIQKYHGNYYISGTKIRIPFFKDFLNSIDEKVLSGVGIPAMRHMGNSCYDHAYHRPFSQVAHKKINSQCLINKTSKIKGLLKERNCVRSKSNLNTKLNCVKNSNSLKSVVNKTVSEIDVIPVIDLTNDPAPNSPIKEIKLRKKDNISNWRFCCHGCGYKLEFMEQSAAYSQAAKHMKDFHSVTDINSFLNVCNTQSGVMIEAFPGYKRN